MCARIRGCVFSYSFVSYPSSPQLYTLSLHDALPISAHQVQLVPVRRVRGMDGQFGGRQLEDQPVAARVDVRRSEEHTSELQSRQYLVCRLLLEKKKNTLVTNEA